MTPDTAGGDPYEAVLSDLRAKRAQIDQTIELLESVRSGKMPSAASPARDMASQPDIQDHAGMFLGMSIVDASKKLLALRKRSMNNPEIAKELKAGGLVLTGADPVNVIGSVLTRRFNQVGDVVRVGRGTWGLKEWYPNRSFKPAAKTSPTSATAQDNDDVSEPTPDESMSEEPDAESDWNS